MILNSYQDVNDVLFNHIIENNIDLSGIWFDSCYWDGLDIQTKSNAKKTYITKVLSNCFGSLFDTKNNVIKLGFSEFAVLFSEYDVTNHKRSARPVLNSFTLQFLSINKKVKLNPLKIEFVVLSKHTKLLDSDTQNCLLFRMENEDKNFFTFSDLIHLLHSSSYSSNGIAEKIYSNSNLLYRQDLNSYIVYHYKNQIHKESISLDTNASFMEFKAIETIDCLAQKLGVKKVVFLFDSEVVLDRHNSAILLDPRVEKKIYNKETLNYCEIFKKRYIQ